MNTIHTEAKQLLDSLVALELPIASHKFTASERRCGLAILRNATIDIDYLQQLVALLADKFSVDFHASKIPASPTSLRLSDTLSALASGFPVHKSLDDDLLGNLIDEGPECLDDTQLANVIVNPVAVVELYDVVNETLPDVWFEPMRVAGISRMRQHGLSTKLDQAVATVPVDPVVTAAKAPMDEQSKNKSSLVVTLASLSLVASLLSPLLLGWYLTSTVIDGGAQQLAVSPVGGQSGGGGFQLQSSGGGLDWTDLWAEVNPDDPSNSIKRVQALGGQEIRDGVESMRRKGFTDQEILAVWHERFQSDELARDALQQRLRSTNTDLTKRVAILKEKGFSDGQIASFLELFE